MKYPYIAVEGNIGAGKSTLASKLSAALGAHILEEQFEENPLLPAFYGDPKPFAYPLEVSFLMDRFRDVKRNIQPGRRTVADYWFNKSLVFARVNLKGEQFAQFEGLFNTLVSLLPSPDLLIYYHRPVDKVQEGILTRGRPFELSIKRSYLERVEKGFLAYLKKQKQIPVLWVEGSRFHPARNREDMNRLLNLLDVDFRPGLNYPKTGV